LGLHRRLAMKV